MKAIKFVLPIAAVIVVLLAHASPPAAALDLASGLLVTSRPGLEICVESLPNSGITTADATSLVRGSVATLSAHPRYASSGYADVPAQVVSHCPSAPALFASGERHEINGGPAQVFSVTRPSSFRTFVYVAPEADITRVFGNAPYPMSAQESMCRDRDCFEVTTAIYISAAAVKDSSVLRDRLAKGVGLESAAPRVDPKR